VSIAEGNSVAEKDGTAAEAADMADYGAFAADMAAAVVAVAHKDVDHMADSPADMADCTVISAVLVDYHKV